MTTEADYHEITVADADWRRVRAEVKAHPWAPDDPRLRHGHSSRGQQERWLMGRLVLERWADANGVELDDLCIAKETDRDGPGNLQVPEKQLDENPGHRFCHLLAPKKQVGRDTVWLFAGWAWTEEVKQCGVSTTLPKKPRRVTTRRISHTPDDLIAELKGDDGR
jgi:hypothetical protein